MGAAGRLRIAGALLGAAAWEAWEAAPVPVSAAAPMPVSARTESQEVTARAFLDAAEVGVGRTFTLSVEVSGAQQTDGDPVLPDMEDFAAFLSAGTSTSIRMVNGRTSVAVTYQYRFQALKEGDFEIGSVSVTVGGRTLRTEPIALTVSDAPPAPRGGGGGEADPGGAVSADDLFIETTVSRARAFVNEPVAVEYKIFTRVDVESYSVTALPQATGFWSEELEQPDAPRTETVVRDGVQYVVATVRRALLFPTGAGPRTLDPLAIEAQVRVRDRSAFNPFGDLFGRSSLFDRRVPVEVASRPVTIEVVPLPAEGRPDDFAGHVGTLEVSTSLSRAEAETNEAVTFRVEYSGTGNLRALPAPAIEFPADFEAFPPESAERISEVGGNMRGTRSFEYVLIPRVPGELTVPAVRTAYFDPASRSYGAARAEPLRLTVAGDADAAAGAGDGPAAVEAIREEIRFIHTGAPRFRRADAPIYGAGAFWLVLLAPPIAVGGATVLRRRRDRLAGDAAYARLRRSDRVARKRLARARKLADGDPADFYGEVAGALQGLLADKLNVAAASLVRDDARRLAARRGASAATLDSLFAFLDECDRQRFAPVGTARDAPASVLERAAAIMADLAREIGR